MMELIVVIFSCGLMYKIVDLDPQTSPVIWTVVSFVTCMLCLAIPLPFLRVFIGLLASIGALVGYKALAR